MDWLIGIGGVLNDTLVVLTAIISFAAWKKIGFKAPGYIHTIALLGGCIGALLAFMGYVSGAEQDHRAIWLIVGFPIGTYFFFGFFGGGMVMADREDKHRDGMGK